METKLKNKLIESIYDVTINIDKYTDFLSLWEDEFLQSHHDQLPINSAIENHVSKAFNILKVTQPLTDDAPNLKQSVETNPLPTFILSRDKQILMANQAALQFLKIKLNKKLPANSFASHDILKINQYLNQLDKVKTGKILAVIQPQDDDGEATMLFSLSKAYDEKSATDYLQISAVHTIWNDDVGKVIQKAFDLSDTELDIAKRHVAGERLTDIANIKQRSINTLRTQSKSLLRKTKLKTQSELVRLFSALQSFNLPEPDSIINTKNSSQTNLISSGQNNVVTSADGRHLYYEIYGNPDGQPVLYLHGMISGTKFPQNMLGYLYAQNIKLIAPHRAGFGKSDPCLKDDSPENFLDDVKAILDAEKVTHFKIIAQFEGAYYAFLLAAQMAERIKNIRLINMQLPLNSKALLADIKAPRKAMVHTAKYLPHILPFLLHIVEAQLKKLGADYVMGEYFKNSKYDNALRQNPEMNEIIMDGCQCCYAHGGQFLIAAARLSFQTDWSDLITNCPLNVELYHATDDISVAAWQIEALAAKHQHLKLTIIDGGHLMLYKHPENILNNL